VGVAVDGERLAGGHNTREVVRVGDTVRRTAGPGFAVEVLKFLEAAGYAWAPRYRGRDAAGRDILTYVDGRTSDHPSQRDPGACGMAGGILRELHDLTSGSVLAGERECVIHGDPGPFNTVFRDGRPVALIDWDSSRPGGRLEDLAYMAWTWGVQALGTVPIEDQAQHVRLLRLGYGGVGPEVLVDAMLARQTQLAEIEAANAEDPHLDAERRRHAVGAVEWALNDRALLERHRDAFLR
jgi:hypothetical protein